ncbi:MAG: hypothetical protein WAM14_00665 [Candidatus Nitrosopolaris sp.]
MGGKFLLLPRRTEQDEEVKIIQKWDSKRLPIQPLLRDFRRWLIQKRIDDVEASKKTQFLGNQAGDLQ